MQSEEAALEQIRWAVLRASPAKAIPQLLVSNVLRCSQLEGGVARSVQFCLQKPIQVQQSLSLCWHVTPAHLPWRSTFPFLDEKVLIPADSVKAFILTVWKPTSLYEYGNKGEDRQAQAYKFFVYMHPQPPQVLWWLVQLCWRALYPYSSTPTKLCSQSYYSFLTCYC